MNTDQSIHNKLTNLPKHFWQCWSLVILVIFLIHLLTLTISPTIWQDEVQIIEYGRLFFESDTTWSTNWNTQTASPNFTLFYLGPALQEIAFKLANYSVAGPRLWSIVGALVASTSLVSWLLSRRVVPLFAGLIGIIFLIDPMFVQSYRGDRLEAWVFALIFLSAWLIRRQTNRFELQGLQISWQEIIPIIAIGILTAMAFYVWPSAILLYPLIAIEFVDLLKKIKKSNTQDRTLFSLILAVFVSCFIVTFVLLLIPVLGQLQILIKHFFEHTSSVSGKQSISSSLIALIKSYIRNPFLPLMGCLGILFNYRRNKLLVFAFFVVLGAVLASGTYIYRSIYLLPYFVLFASLLFNQKIKWSWLEKSMPIIVTLGLIWAVSLSLIMRPLVSLSTANSRQPSLLLNAAKEVIVDSSTHVFIEPFEFYPTGRKLKWKMYKPFNGHITDLLEQVDVDYGILSNAKDKMIMINEESFMMAQQLSMKEDKVNLIQSFLIDKLPAKGSSGYGSYYLYKKL